MSGLVCRAYWTEARGFGREDREIDFLTVSCEEEAELDLDLLRVCAVGVMMVATPAAAQADGADTVIDKDVACSVCDALMAQV